jgi:hypothetical protein
VSGSPTPPPPLLNIAKNRFDVRRNRTYVQNLNTSVCPNHQHQKFVILEADFEGWKNWTTPQALATCARTGLESSKADFWATSWCKCPMTIVHARFNRNPARKQNKTFKLHKPWGNTTKFKYSFLGSPGHPALETVTFDWLRYLESSGVWAGGGDNPSELDPKFFDWAPNFAAPRNGILVEKPGVAAPS